MENEDNIIAVRQAFWLKNKNEWYVFVVDYNTIRVNNDATIKNNVSENISAFHLITNVSENISVFHLITNISGEIVIERAETRAASARLLYIQMEKDGMRQITNPQTYGMSYSNLVEYIKDPNTILNDLEIINDGE